MTFTEGPARAGSASYCAVHKVSAEARRDKRNLLGSGMQRAQAIGSDILTK
jgi:hypothetical protein